MDTVTLTLTAEEARILTNILARITPPSGCAVCTKPIGDSLPVCDGDGSNVRHAECDDLLNEPVDSIATEAQMQATVATYVEKFLAMANAHPDTPKGLGYFFDAEKSGRNYRIIMYTSPAGRAGGGGSVHAFIDRTTGDVYKPEGWKKPAKGVRYNLVTEFDLVAERFHFAGGYLYQEVASVR